MPNEYCHSFYYSVQAALQHQINVAFYPAIRKILAHIFYSMLSVIENTDKTFW